MSFPLTKRLLEFGRKVGHNLTTLGSPRYLRAKTSNFPSLFPRKAQIIRVATGFRFTEGPVWFSKGRYLLFSDIHGNTIFKLSANGQVTVFRQPSGNSNISSRPAPSAIPCGFFGPGANFVLITITHAMPGGDSFREQGEASS